MNDLQANDKSELKTKSAFGFGISAALVASLCCLIPLIAIVIGLSGFSFLFSFTKYRSYFLALSLILLAVTLWWNWQRNRKCCQTKEARDKLLNITLTIAVVYTIILGLLNFGLPKALASYQAANTKRLTLAKNEVKLKLQISGLTCPSCTETIRQTLKKQKGVKEASFSYPSGKGYVIYNKSQISKKKILQVLKKAGYKAKSVSLKEPISPR